MITIIGIYLVVFLVYFKCPKYLKLIIIGINLFLPDALPIVDEAIMIIGLLATRGKQVEQGVKLFKARKQTKVNKEAKANNVENALE